MIIKIITTLLHDVCKTRGDIFNYHSLRLTLNKLQSRIESEGISFITKTMPRLGKGFDQALAGQDPLTASKYRFSTMPGSKLPRFLGELFSRVLDSDGHCLPNPCVDSIAIIRQILYSFYKYKLPYDAATELQVIQKFERTEEDLVVSDAVLSEIKRDLDSLSPHCAKRVSAVCARRKVGLDCFGVNCHSSATSRERGLCYGRMLQVARTARHLLSDVFAVFDPKDIFPRHGPGAVATRQQLWDKYRWSNISANITSKYPIEEYFSSSLGALADADIPFNGVSEEDLPARVILVPKDSRGPRLISAEPIDYQWIQQGLGTAIRTHVESPVLGNHAYKQVNFTDQQPNQLGALLGSQDGRYSTLDLNEASDRVSVELVRLLFPAHICGYLEACRSSATQLPDGRVIKLRKFAPMGSSLCFPILALTTWAILTAGTDDTDVREHILVYGDDVIVPTAYAADAMELLEAFGLKINRAKSCTKGLFRESCGVDAFQGRNVTPVKFKTVWSSSRSADVFAAFIDYSNELFERGFYLTSNLIAEELIRVYGPIPGEDAGLPCPSLKVVPLTSIRSKPDIALQTRKYWCPVVSTPRLLNGTLSGWSLLLRYFAEAANQRNVHRVEGAVPPLQMEQPFRVRLYTKRDTSIVERTWVRPAPRPVRPRPFALMQLDGRRNVREVCINDAHNAASVAALP